METEQNAMKKLYSIKYTLSKRLIFGIICLTDANEFGLESAQN